jgi:hypothetical protein
MSAARLSGLARPFALLFGGQGCALLWLSAFDHEEAAVAFARFVACLSASAVAGLLLVKPASAGCDGVPYSVPTFAGRELPDFVDEFYRKRAVAACVEAEAKADARRREIERLPDSYDRKYSDLTTIDRYKKSLETGAADAGRYEKMIEEDAQRRKNGGWVLPESSSVPSSYYPPGGDPHGVRLGVAPKGTAKDLSDVKSRVLELKSQGH